MFSLIEGITKRLTEAWRPEETTTVRGRSYRCQCGRQVYFRNSECLSCRAPLGYETELAQLRALEPGPVAKTWKLHGQKEAVPLWRRCKNFDSPVGCNWLIPAAEEATLCRSCRLNRTIPSLDDAWDPLESTCRHASLSIL